MKLIATLIITLIIASCADTHSDRSIQFERALQVDLNLDAKVIKNDTRKKNYIIVRNNTNNSYTAYNISNYDPKQDINTFLENNQSNFYYDLKIGNPSVLNLDTRWAGETIYVDEASGVYFSKQKMTTSDLTKANELIDQIKYNNAKEELVVTFVLSPKRAAKVAKLSLQLINEDKAHMTSYNYDQYSKAILGSSLSEIELAFQQHKLGHKLQLNQVYKKAAAINKISVEQVDQLANLFIKNM